MEFPQQKSTLSDGTERAFLSLKRKISALDVERVKNKFPISENNIEKGIDKIPKMVYNSAINKK